MRPGQLDRIITIQKPGGVDDPLYGPQPGGWLDVAVRVPAQKQDLLPSDTEDTGTGLRVSHRPARIRIRYMRGLTADMRIILHEETDEVYAITSTPAEIGRREWTEFTVRAFSS